jgi:hypothetical protein
MALKTLGTNATNSLSAFIVDFNDTIAADLATMNNAIKQDPPVGSLWSPVATTGLINQSTSSGTGTTRQVMNQAYIKNGVLIIPKRGQLVLRSGDFICWDSTTGWPIVISGDAAANGPYTHT